jgi:hypothetical protein
MGALSSLSLKSNGLLNKKSGEALAGVLKANSVLTELDISSNYDTDNSTSQDGAGFAQALAVGLIDNGALLQLHFAKNAFGIEGTQFLCDSLGLSVRCRDAVMLEQAELQMCCWVCQAHPPTNDCLMPFTFLSHDVSDVCLHIHFIVFSHCYICGIFLRSQFCDPVHRFGGQLNRRH